MPTIKENKRIKRVESIIEKAEITSQTNYQTTEELKFTLDLKEELDISYNQQIVDSVFASELSTYIEGDFTIEPKVIDPETQKELPVEFNVEKKSNTVYEITAINEEVVLEPGKYQLQIDLTKGRAEMTKTQDFTWGVLTLNTSKSVYTPHETANIAMAVLDENGGMVCDADVVLSITNPSGNIQVLSTENGSVVVNPGCLKKEMILEPDFEAWYDLGEPGIYQVQLSASTENGKYSIEENILVKENVSFDVERITATRIYPKVNYPVVIKITANQDYEGPIREIVPEDYKIYELNKQMAAKLTKKELLGEFITGANVKNGGGGLQIIEWETNLQEGQTYYLAYEYDAPNKSPDYHLLGPLTIGNFTEQRYWQIAVDDIAILDVHSSPKEGENWVVRFETNGQDDLYIIPDDQATIDDDEFTSLWCGEEEMFPQILDNDVIYYPNWECSTTAKVIHKTLKAGTHTLRFEFRGQTAYAYNTIWLIGWDYRKEITIDGSTAGAQTNYPIKVVANKGTGTDSGVDVFLGSNVQDDFDDIRFTTSDGYTELDYYREIYTDGTAAIFWVEVDSIAASPSTTDIYMYYSNSSASTTSDPEDVFIRWEDFEETTFIFDTPGSTGISLSRSSDTTAIEGSYIGVNSGSDGYKIEYDGTASYSGSSVMAAGWVRTESNSGNERLGPGFAFEGGGSGSNNGYQTIMDLRGSVSPQIREAWNYGTRTNGVYGASSWTWYYLELYREGNDVKATLWTESQMYSNSAQTTTTRSNDTTYTSGNWGVATYAGNSSAWDAVRLRNHTYPEPSINSFGSEEQPQIDITGTAYTDDDEGTTLDGVSICAAVASTFTTGDCDTTSSGAFDIQDVIVSGQGSQQITLFVDGGSTFGNTVTNHYVDNITGLKLYQNHIYLDYFTGDSISIIDMDDYDNDQNSTDMLFDAEDSSPDTLSWESGSELYVPSGNEFIPGGNVNGHDIEIDGTWTAASGETINVDGSFKIDVGATYSNANQTVTFDATSGTEDLITDGTGDIYNLIIDDGGGGSLVVEVEDPLSIQNNLTITNGSLDVVSGENNQITIFGNWTNDDTFEARNGTVIFDGASDATLDSGCADEDTCTNQDFYNLTIQKDEDAKVTLSNTHLRVGNLLNVITGWLIQDAQNIRAEGTTAIDIDDFGRWENTSTGDITLGGDVINDGNITINGNGGTCGDNDDIAIASTNTSARSWGGEGGFRISDVAVSYQTGSAVIYASSSTNNGNMGSNWRFTGCDQILFEGLGFDNVDIN